MSDSLLSVFSSADTESEQALLPSLFKLGQFLFERFDLVIDVFD
jgi:hypothetical protein